MKLKFIAYASVSFLLVLSACQTTSDSGEPVEEAMMDRMEETADQVGDEMTSKNESGPAMLTDGIQGMVRYLSFEGGFYGIVGEDGNNYLPLNLEEEFKQDSLQVRFTYERREDVMTIAMWGQSVDITAIERVN